MASDPTSLAYRLFRKLSRTRPGMSDGLAVALEAIQSAPGGRAWRTVQADQLEAGLDPFMRWLAVLVKKAPPPASTAALWFEVPEVDLNPAYTSVSAYDVFDRLDEFFGFEEGRTWPEDKRGVTLPIGLHQLPELEQALASVGWRDPAMTTERSESLTPGAFALTFSYITLLVLNALPHSPFEPLLHRDGGLAVVVGWYSGDAFPLGMLPTQGWATIK
ncbi:MAG TPA: hypothetical protein PLU35_06225 [Phycisphaerales bacterium]|nr:hypothetical protein [Phycisphaerales bacterium]